MKLCIVVLVPHLFRGSWFSHEGSQQDLVTDGTPHKGLSGRGVMDHGPCGSSSADSAVWTRFCSFAVAWLPRVAGHRQWVEWRLCVCAVVVRGLALHMSVRHLVSWFGLFRPPHTSRCWDASVLEETMCALDTVVQAIFNSMWLSLQRSLSWLARGAAF